MELLPPHHLDGEINDVVFASVPMTTSHHSCERLRDSLIMAFKGKKQIMIITHNVELLEAKKLSSTETAAIILRIEELQGVRDAGGGAEQDEGLT